MPLDAGIAKVFRTVPATVGILVNSISTLHRPAIAARSGPGVNTIIPCDVLPGAQTCR